MIVLAIGQSQATVVKVPDKIDFANTMTSFKYSDSAQSADGKKRDWFAWLMTNGNFQISGIYLGEDFGDCSARGGEAEVVMDNNNVRRQELLKLALLSFNENQNAPAGPVGGDYEMGPQL